MSDTSNDPVNRPEPTEPAATPQPAVSTPAEAPETPAVEPAAAAPVPPIAPAAPAAADAGAQPVGAVGQPQPVYQPPQPPAYQAPQPAQPTQPYPNGYQPTQPTQPLPRYGEQVPLPGQPGAQQPPQPGQPQHPGYYGHAYYTPGGGPAAPQAPKPAREPGKGLTGKTIALIAAGLVVGAIIGGAAGGGIGSALSKNGGGTTASSSTGSQNITVNDPDKVTQVTAVAAKASPSVVTISVTASQEAGTGSGVVLTADGYVLTNTHVVTLDGDVSGASIQVQTNDGKLYTAKLVGTDPTDDLAVIKLEGASGLQPITFADSSKINVGDQVIAIGSPLGLNGTVTDGIVSALNRSVTLQSSAAPSDGSGSGGDGSDGGSDGGFGWPLPSNPFGGGDSSTQSDTIAVPAIQTDAAINPGNSGGALLNAKGELIGINVAIASTGTSSDSEGQSGNIGVGFAIPSNIAQRIAGELQKNGKATHGLLGATVQNAAASQDATEVGAEIHEVNAGSAAAKAGLKADDVVTNFGGVPITSSTDLTAQVRAQAAGASVKLSYVRDGKSFDTTVTLGSYDPNA